MSFSEDIKAHKKLVLEELSTQMNLVTHDLFTEVVARSPSPSNPGFFAKGYLVNQYYTQIGGISTTLGTATNDIGVDSLSRISSTLSEKPFYGKDSSVSMSNSTEEMIYAEEIGWTIAAGLKAGHKWSGNIAPYAMIRNSVVFIQSKYGG